MACAKSPAFAKCRAFGPDDKNFSPNRAPAKELGGNLLNGPFDVSVGHISVVTDGQGAVFQLTQLTVPADE